MRCRIIRNSQQVRIVKDSYIFFAFSTILMEKLGKTMIMFVRVVLIVPGFITKYFKSKCIVYYYYLHKSLVVTSKVI